jgi:signal transduction histidine kinase
MSRETSIHRRILLVLLVAQGILTTAAVTAVLFYTHRQMLAAFDSELRRRMITTLAMVQIAEEKQGGIEFSARSNAIPSDDLFAVWDSKRRLIAASPQTTSETLSPILSSRRNVFFDAGGRLYRGEFWRSTPLLDQDSEELNQPTPRIDLAYARPADTFRTKFSKVVTIAVAGSCVWLTVSSLIAWFSVSRGLVPLDELAAQASRINERSWCFRPPDSANSITELLPLTEALQDLVIRLKSAFDRERTFVSDAAHELKTAVAIQKSTLQVAANGPPNIVGYRRGFEQALSDIDRMEALVLRMLSLASVEGAIAEESFVRTALDETIVAACDDVASLAGLRCVQLATRGVAPSFVRGDAALLKTLWIALIENAIQHSPPGGSIDVTAETDGAGVCKVTIRDCGEGIAAEDLPRVFDRFYRADRSRSRETGGYGLGLAIAKAIVQRHNGRIDLNSTLGLGTVVQVELPGA